MKRLNQEEIKKHLIDSLVNNDMVETKELKGQAEIIDEPEDVVHLIKR